MPTPPRDDDASKASGPTQIRSQTWAYVLRRTGHEFVEDGCVDAAASLTFFSVLAIFPASLAVLALVGVIGDGDAVVERVLALIGQVSPGAVTDTLRLALADITGAREVNLTLIVSIAVALWSASIYVSAFGRSMNRIFDVDEGRPYWKRKPAQIALTVVLIVMGIIIGAVVVLSGPFARGLGQALGIGDTALAAWDIGKWPLLAAAVVVMVTVLYRGTGNVRPPRMRWLGLGALLAIIVLGLASAGFAFYISGFANYSRTFGALAGVIIFLIWLFIINLALLLGAEFNAELERGRQLQAGIPAEEDLQLPARDTKLSDKRSDFAQETRDRGARLRNGETLEPRTDTVWAKTTEWMRGLTRRTRGR